MEFHNNFLDYYEQVIGKRDYLNSKKFTFGAQFFISNSNDQDQSNLNFKKLTNKAAQNYHFDVDFQKSFKVCIYLSDVF